jgi:hypothetical protein
MSSLQKWWGMTQTRATVVQFLAAISKKYHNPIVYSSGRVSLPDLPCDTDIVSSAPNSALLKKNLLNLSEIIAEGVKIMVSAITIYI